MMLVINNVTQWVGRACPDAKVQTMHEAKTIHPELGRSLHASIAKEADDCDGNLQLFT
jgi:hypothetical protein